MRGCGSSSPVLSPVELLWCCAATAIRHGRTWYSFCAASSWRDCFSTHLRLNVLDSLVFPSATPFVELHEANLSICFGWCKVTAGSSSAYIFSSGQIFQVNSSTTPTLSPAPEFGLAKHITLSSADQEQPLVLQLRSTRRYAYVARDRCLSHSARWRMAVVAESLALMGRDAMCSSSANKLQHSLLN